MFQEAVPSARSFWLLKQLLYTKKVESFWLPTYGGKTRWAASQGFMHSLALAFLVVASLTLAAGNLVTATYNVVDYGAKGDATSDDTFAFLYAWRAACAASSSSTVLVPSESTFMLKQVNFQGPCKSNIHFRVDGNIVAPNKVWSKDADHWITFWNIDGLNIDGSGQIDGRGEPWWSCKENEECSSLVDSFFILKCNNVRLSNLKFVNSPRMHVVIYQTVGAYIRGLTITSPEFSPNTDGIHIEKSQHVEILDSIIGTGDDCVSIGTDTYDINVTRITCGPGHGISIGSLGKHDSEAKVEEINVSYCKLINTTNGVRIKTWQGGSGYAKEITFSHIIFYSVKKPIVIDQYYCVGENNCQNKTSAVQVRDVHYSEVKGTSSSGIAVSLACSETTPCTGITMEDINIQSTNQGGEDATTTCYNAQVNEKGYVVPSLSCPCPT